MTYERSEAAMRSGSGPSLHWAAVGLFLAATALPVASFGMTGSASAPGLLIAVGGLILLGIVFVGAALLASVLEGRELGRLQALMVEAEQVGDQARATAVRVLEELDGPEKRPEIS